MASLAKQFQRDLKANPKKAGMLVLLCVVCLWFWGPLIFPKEESAKKKLSTPAAVVVPAVAATTPVLGVKRPAAADMPWQELAEKLVADVRMQRAFPPLEQTQGPQPRNPFAAVENTETTDQEWEEFLADAAAAEQGNMKTTENGAGDAQAAWNDIPLTLSSTLIGGKTRKAIINGRAFAEGSAIGAVKDIEIRLEHVEPRLAVVVWNGARRELRIPKPGEAPLKDESPKTSKSQPAESDSETSDNTGELTETDDHSPNTMENDALSGDRSE